MADFRGVCWQLHPFEALYCCCCCCHLAVQVCHLRCELLRLQRGNCSSNGCSRRRDVLLLLFCKRFGQVVVELGVSRAEQEACPAVGFCCCCISKRQVACCSVAQLDAASWVLLR